MFRAQNDEVQSSTSARSSTPDDQQHHATEGDEEQMIVRSQHCGESPIVRTEDSAAFTETTDDVLTPGRLATTAFSSPPKQLEVMPGHKPPSPAIRGPGGRSSSQAPLDCNRTRQRNQHIHLEIDGSNVRRDSSSSTESHSSSETAVSSPLMSGYEPRNHTPEPSGLFRHPSTEEAGQSEGYTNERLLRTAFISFMSFALLQLVFALIAGSQAMMGDSAAMLVDALTYLFNWVAERRKNHLDDMVRGHANPMRSRRKLELHMEILPPLLSVATLIVVIVFVLRRSIRILLLDLHRSRNQQSNPNVGLMMVFSILNLFLDGLNVFCFAQAQHLMGYEVKLDHNEASNRSDLRPQQNHQHRQAYEQLDATQNGEGLSATTDHVELSKQQHLEEDYHEVDSSESNEGQEKVDSHHENGNGTTNDILDLDDQQGHAQEHQANLNMCSAYTHVFADTLRSIAVIVAALVAELFPSAVTPEEADATAAVIVSILILLSLVPLLQGLISSISELQSIRADERADALFATSQYNHNAIEC